MKLRNKSRFNTYFNFARSKWAFPLLLTLILLLLTIFRISGSSIGIYHHYFYGNTKDPHLLVGKPRPIRSDEWNVVTQRTIAQKNNNFAKINQNIGNGEDTSIVLDTPYKEWTVLFKPHNWAFFILPLENAFAFKWWLMAYLLILSCYFFVLSIMPKRHLLAILTSLGLFFTPFIQWWYQYATLAPIYYGLFIALIFTYLLRARKIKSVVGLSAVFSYLITSFAFIIYPPFQIPCAIVVGVYCLALLFVHHKQEKDTLLLKKLLLLTIAGIVSLLLIFIFVKTRSSVISVINDTAYPGRRVVESGGYNAPHLFTGNLGMQLQSTTRSRGYTILGMGESNQSGLSNFVLLIPFLFLPSLYLTIKSYRRRDEWDWIVLTALNVVFVVFLLWMFVPHLTLLGKVLFLNKVPLNRLVMGFGILNLIYTVVFIHRVSKAKDSSHLYTALYSIFVLATMLLLSTYVHHHYPGYIGLPKAILLSLPVPLGVYLILRKRFELAITLLLILGVVSTVLVHPLYVGLGVLTDTPISKKIKELNAKNEGEWAVEGATIENIVNINGAPSLSGVYSYPQLDLWKVAGNTGQQNIYNRYAHVNFNFDRDSSQDVNTRFRLAGADNFGVVTEPCSEFLVKMNVRYLLTEVPLNPQDGCTSNFETVTYPTRTFYIYKLF